VKTGSSYDRLRADNIFQRYYTITGHRLGRQLRISEKVTDSSGYDVATEMLDVLIVLFW